MPEKIIQFPKSNEQIRDNMLKKQKAAEYQLRLAEMHFHRAFYTGILPMLEAADETTRGGQKIRKKMEAAGLDYDTCTALIMAHLFYKDALAGYNELCSRTGKPAVALNEFVNICTQHRGEQPVRQQAVPTAGGACVIAWKDTRGTGTAAGTASTPDRRTHGRP